MVAQVTTFAFHGAQARMVKTQIQLSGGANTFTIVGLPDKAVSEARERVRAALSAVGLGLPAKRVTVNLAPADLPKEGSHFDLAIALGLLIELEATPRDIAERYAAIGELGLDGSVAPITGALPAAIAAREQGLGLICPAACGAEAAWSGADSDILAVPSLISMVNHFKGTQVLRAPVPGPLDDGPPVADMRDVKGQESAKRALEVVAAGGHHMLMVGPPGAGKSMLAARLPGILPPLTAAEMLDISTVQSLAGHLEDGRLQRQRPYRAPHHSASMAAMVGGGARPKPGEASLAHHGVLFLDELPEFSSSVLDSLRQPLETGDVLIARANYHVRYPARFQLIAAMNPCRCGYGQASARNCGRGKNCEATYQSRISGPMLDRLDVRVALNAVAPTELDHAPSGEDSKTIAVRVNTAREAQTERAKTLAGQFGLPETPSDIPLLNAALPDAALSQIAMPDDDGRAFLIRAAETLQFSARAYFRVLRVARSLADLDGKDAVQRCHIAEAVSYRGHTPSPPVHTAAPQSDQGAALATRGANP